MPSTWDSIPLSDYEAHVELPTVAQAPAIREILASLTDRFRPQSMIYLGCAGGNGLASIVCPDVLAVDRNAEYLRVAKERYPGVRFQQCDLDRGWIDSPPVDLIFGALLFEYLEDLPGTLGRLVELLKPEGKLAMVLLQPSTQTGTVTPSQYTSLQALAAEFHFVKENEVAGMRLILSEDWVLPGGKGFATRVYARFNPKV